MEKILQYHVLALITGYILDLIIGDPHSLPHPIRLIGRWISFIEKKVYKDTKTAGFILAVFVVVPVFTVTFIVWAGAYIISPIAGILIESVITFYCLATKSLMVESRAVREAFEKSGISEARKALSMIVGRDTNSLTEEETVKAAVETVAENTSDGVVAPLIYLALFGPVMGLTYKACNTMDSMIGYKNERYKNFGYTAAKLDDIMNFFPSRICACFIILTAFLLKGLDGKNAFKIWKRDRLNHKSPNSAQSESAYAGALGLKLAGGAYYFGKWVEKPYIGDEIKKIEWNDIGRSHTLLYGTSILCEVICTAVIFIIIKLNMTFL